MKIELWVLLFIVVGLTWQCGPVAPAKAQDSTIVLKSPDPFSMFHDVSQETGCNGLEMELYQQLHPGSDKGLWVPATCVQIVQFLHGSRDVRNIIVRSPRRDSPLPHVLYPQYRSWFTFTVEEWKLLQAKAAQNLKETGKYAHADVATHWQSIVAGKVPFGLQVEK